MQTLPFESATGCVLESHALVEVPLAEIRGLRDAPVPDGAPALPPRFLRHCDEHTVVGVRAVLEAIAALPDPTRPFDRYGVVGAPRIAGRITGAQTLVQAAAAGGIAVSPHVVPQCSLHALASAVSVALGMHGLNLGAGGGPEALSEGLYTAISLVNASACAGLWLVLTEWDEEPVLDAVGRPTGDPLCRAVALALRPPAAPDASTVAFTIRNADPIAACDQSSGTTGHGLADLARAVAACAGGGGITSWSHICPWGAEIRIVAPAAAARPARSEDRGPARREAA
ncbi:hypothetical protein EBR56_00655 [bacterium]|nr:hypothetical protein [bacterium]